MRVDVSDIQSRSSSPSEYKLVAAILHKGQMLSSGHYVSLKILPELDTVLVFDDEKVERKSLDYLSKRSIKKEVYMAFYVKVDDVDEKKSDNIDLTKTVNESYESSPVSKNNGISESIEVYDDGDLCGGNEKLTDVDIESSDEQLLENHLESAHKPIETYQALDITNKEKAVGKVRSVTVYGRDLKTLEYPPINTSYSLDKPGELNDTILLAYFYLIEDARQALHGLGYKLLPAPICCAEQHDWQ